MTPQRLSPPPIARGVYQQAYRTLANEILLVAISSAGMLVGEVRVSDETGVEAAWSYLEERLNRADPRAELRLVG